MANDVRIRATVNDQVSGPLGKIRDRFDHLGKSKGLQSIVSGVGLGIGMQAWNMALGSINGLIGDSIEAAKAEEVSIQKLGSALQANIRDWDGNTDAIERTLKARMELGFSDDEQRDSLARLVSTTKDATKALALQRTAMDLARLRNIDLAAASDIVGKVYGGNIGILARYGIQLRKGVTATEALAEVQRRAAGQAEDYAETNTGKLLVSQVKIGEAMEKLGFRILPVAADAMTGVADAITGASTALDILDGKLPKTTEEVMDAEQSFIDLADSLSMFIPAAGIIRDAMESNTTEVERFRGKAEDDLSIVSSAMDRAGDKAGDFAGEVEGATGDVIKSYDEMVDALTDDTSRLIDDVYDPAILHAELAATKEEYAEQKRIATSKNSTDEQIRDAKRRMLTLTKNADETRLQLLEAGELTAEETKEWLTKLERRYNKSTGRAKADVGALIAKIKELSAVTAPGIDIVIRGLRTAVGKGQLRAAGGPIDPGKVYMVGENGPEMFVSKDAGTIVPNHKLGGGKKGSVGPLGLDSTTITVNVVSPGVLSPAHGQAIAREIGPHLRDYLNRRG